MTARRDGQTPAASRDTWVVPAPHLGDDGKPVPTRTPYPRSSVTPPVTPVTLVRPEVVGSPGTASAPTSAQPGEPATPPDQPAGAAPVVPPAGPTDERQEAPDDTPTARKGWLSPRVRNWVETAAVFIVGLVLALLLRSFVLQAFSIPSDSMVPTLVQGDRVVVWKPSDTIADLDRGDVVVFERPNVAECPFAPQDPKDLIKRLVGLPGEEVSSQDGQVTVDGKVIDESYLPPGTLTEFDRPITVPDGHILMLGDNRGASKDGRCFGPIEEEAIVGRATTRVWPVDRWGGL